MSSDLGTIGWLLPELWLIVAGTAIVVCGAFCPARRLWSAVSLVVLAVAGGLLCWWEAARWLEPQPALLSGPLVNDPMAFLWRHLALLAGALFVLLAACHTDERFQPEIQGLLVLVTAGTMLAARANELVLAFLALELVSVPTYALLFLGGRSRANAEATAKYFYLSILASAVFLFGLGYLYGAAGTTWIYLPEGHSLQQAIPGGGKLALVGLSLVLVGLGFKVAAVPFHFYAPDVYQGTSYTNTALLSVAPKLAGLAVLVRLLVVGFQAAPAVVWPVLVVLAAVTMTLGNVCALWQRNLRRLMAYSSIAHSGFLLMGVAASAAGLAREPFGGVAAVSFYLFAYSLATIGLFAAFAAVKLGDTAVDGLEHLAGYSRRHPWHAAAIAVFLLSLAGVPPLAGFWAKLGVFLSALSGFIAGESAVAARWLLGLAVVGAVNAAIGAAYYLRVVAVLYFGTPSGSHPPAQMHVAWPLQAAVVFCAVLVVGLGIHQRPLSTWSQRAEQSLSMQSAVDVPAKRAEPHRVSWKEPSSLTLPRSR
ncbi:MAG: NADH-quinone oxidoreductase subunit N [Pirellulaceae bacterium]|nr:MAG: NADH-quinone oxidoreductase subunit N [Pirellulaceae bacterium]